MEPCIPTPVIGACKYSDTLNFSVYYVGEVCSKGQCWQETWAECKYSAPSGKRQGCSVIRGQSKDPRKNLLHGDVC